MNELPRQKLRELVARHGQSVGDDARRSEGLLKDYCGEHRREVSVLVMAVEERVPADLRAAPAGVAREVLLARLTRRLCDNLALSEDAARWAVNSWALALGVVSEEELKSLERRGHAAAPQADALPPPAEGKEPRDITAEAADIVVSARGGGDYLSIGEALKSAGPGSRLLVRPGLYEEGLTIDRDVEIVGDGPPDEIIVKAGAASCVRVLTGRARVAGLTLRGGGEGFFAVDVVQGRLLLEDCDVTSETLSCVAAHGPSAEPLIRRCRIHGGADSGLYFFDGASGALEDCEVYANANVGVAITGGAHAAVKRSRIHGGENAGVVAWGRGTTGLLEDCEVYGNRLAGVGVSDEGKLTASACRIQGGENSGVLIHRGGDGTLEKCDIYGHGEAQVAVESDGQLTALRCDIHQGRDSGVVVREGGKALLQECAVVGNADAGVSIGADSLAAVLGCRVRDNGRAGVKVAEGGAARVSDSDLSGNQQGAWDADEGAFVEGGNNVEG